MKNLINVSEIRDFVNSLYDIKIEDRNRTFSWVYYRGVYMMLCRIYLPLAPLKSIGDAIGRTHATVINGLIKFRVMIESDIKAEQIYAEEYEQIHQKFIDRFGHRLDHTDVRFSSRVDLEIREDNKALYKELDRLEKEHLKEIQKKDKKYNNLVTRYHKLEDKYRSNQAKLIKSKQKEYSSNRREKRILTKIENINITDYKND